MDAYDNYGACGQITEFVDALSNWYVRRSRDRFWSADKQDADKLDAYWTLYECLLTTCKLIAPFVPFLAEAMWQNLAVRPLRRRAERPLESVHLCDYPQPATPAIDRRAFRAHGRWSAKSSRWAAAPAWGPSSRSASRWPRWKSSWPTAAPGLARRARGAGGRGTERQAGRVIARADQYITYTVLPDLKRLGPKLGKRLPALQSALAAADAAALLAELETDKQVTLELPDGPVTLDAEDSGPPASQAGLGRGAGPSCVVVLSTELTPELLAEGLARELVHAIQNRRKELAANTPTGSKSAL